MTVKYSSLNLLIFMVVCSFFKVFAEICSDGTRCTGRKHCCENGCCYDDSDTDDDRRYSYGYRLSIWNMWYFWFVVLFVLMSCFGGCGYYKQRQRILRNQQGFGHGFLSVFQVPQRSSRQSSSRIVTLEPTGYSAPMGYGYSQSSAARGETLAPPPYSEVMSNPQMFPANAKSGLPNGTENPPLYPDNRQGDLHSGQTPHEPTNQLPQPPPYSEVSNQNPAPTSTANHN